MAPTASKTVALGFLLALVAVLLGRVSWQTGEDGAGNMFTRGAFAPVEPTNASLLVHGFEGLKGLRGMLLRNGPNPVLPVIPGHHWFDGDGFVHAVRFAAGGATYAGHQIQTPRLVTEVRSGKPIWPRFGAIKGAAGLARLLLDEVKAKLGLLPDLDVLERGTANTAFAVHPPSGAVYATNEGSAPFRLGLHSDGQVSSEGYEFWGGGLTHAVTAHPKYDPQTGELLFFGYDLVSKDHDAVFSRVDAGGSVVSSVGVKFRWKAMMHDWAASETRGIFLHMPLVFDVKNLVQAPSGDLFQYNASATAAFGVFPRNMTDDSEVVWIDAGEAMFIMHSVSAWDVDEDRVLLTAVKMSRFDLDFAMGDPILHSYVWQWQLNVRTREVEWKRQISTTAGEFPVVNEDWRCRKHRWSYFAQQGPVMYNGLVKLDLQEGREVARIEWSPELEAGEFVFAPREGGDAEDDGFLVGTLTNGTSLVSHVRVFDARTFDPTPLVLVDLPRRVPHGFHAQWVPQAVLDAQVAGRV